MSRSRDPTPIAGAASIVSETRRAATRASFNSGRRRHGVRAARRRCRPAVAGCSPVVERRAVRQEIWRKSSSGVDNASSRATWSGVSSASRAAKSSSSCCRVRAAMIVDVTPGRPCSQAIVTRTTLLSLGSPRNSACPDTSAKRVSPNVSESRADRAPSRTPALRRAAPDSPSARRDQRAHACFSPEICEFLTGWTITG